MLIKSKSRPRCQLKSTLNCWPDANDQACFDYLGAIKAKPTTKLHAARRQPNINVWFLFIVIFCYNINAQRPFIASFSAGQVFFKKIN